MPGLALGFRPVNVVARLEDPLAAAERVAARTHTIFLDDCALVRDSAGLARAMRSIATGALPWAQILAALPEDAPVVVDLRRAELTMPVYDTEWLGHQPDLTVRELADLYARAADGDVGADALMLRGSAAIALLAG